MKKFLITLLALSCIGTAFGQRLDDMRFTHNYLQLPSAPLEGDFKTYAVQINTGSLNLAKMGMIQSSMIDNYFELENYTYEANKGDFLIVVNLDGDHYVSKEIKTNSETQGRGDDAKVVKTYSYEVKYRIPITYQVLDGKREVMVDEIFSGYDRLFTTKFGKASTTSILEKEWTNGGDAALETAIKNSFANEMQRLGQALGSRYDTRALSETLIFYSIKKADKIGYEELAAGVAALQTVIEGATAEQALTAADFGNNISLWETALQNASPEDKKESVAFQAAAYNLANVQVLTGDFAAATATAARLNEAGRRGYLFTAIQPFVENRTQRHEANQEIAQRFYATYDEASAQAYQSQMAQNQEVIEESGDLTGEGFVILRESNDSLHGILTYDYKEIKGSDGAVKFEGVTIEDQSAGGQAKRYVKVDELLYLERDGITYFPVFVSFGPIGLMTLQEPIHSTEGLILSRLDEGGDEYSYCMTHIAANRKGEAVKKVYTLDDGMAFFNLNKFIGNKFEDCTTIASKAASGGYERSETSYRQLVDDYTACKSGTISN